MQSAGGHAGHGDVRVLPGRRAAPSVQRVAPLSARGRAGGAARAGLGGTGRVADDLWLMAHHEVSGKPFLQPRPLGIGLAAALLGELILAGGVVLGRDGTVVACGARPGEDLARQLQDQVAAEPERHPVPDWLLFLAQTAAERVARRLEQAGYVTLAGRRPWRAGRWVPADPDWAFAPLIRACSALDPVRPFDAGHGALAGLAVACGLGFRLAQYLTPAGLGLDQTAGRLDPGLRELIAQVQAAVDGAVLSHRT